MTEPFILPTDLRDYAKAQGWKLDPAGAPHRLYVLEHPDQPRRQLVFPMDTTVLDYAEVMTRTVAKLAVMEGRSAAAVWSAVKEVRCDALAFRVQAERQDTESLPLSFAGAMMTGVQNLLLASACSALRPQAHHPRLSRVEAKQVLETARFGHTLPGSFILNVSCPVDGVQVQTAQSSEGEAVPFVRRTTLMLMRSLTGLVQAIEGDQIEELTALSGIPLLSSNFCEALGKFEEPALGNSLEVSVRWAARLLPAAQDAGLSTVRIQRDYFRPIEQLGRRLRAQSPHHDGKFVGTVEGLDGEMGPEGQRFGEVLLSILTSEGERVEARASLDAEQYAKAYQAHSSVRGFVQITGRLHPGRQPRRLSDIVGFDLVHS